MAAPHHPASPPGHNPASPHGHNPASPHGHNVRPTSWVTVLLIVTASVLLGFALPMRSLPLAIAGGIVLVLGIIMGVVYRILDDAY